MDALPATVDDAALARAVERNTAELLLRMGDVGGGSRRDGDVAWTLGGSPIDYHNAVVGAALDAATAPAVILESRETLARAGVPGTWHVGPSMRPTDLPARLEAAGFAPDGEEPGMAASLDRELTADRTDIEFERVHDLETLGEWVDALGRGFGEGPREAEWVGAMFARLGLDRPDWHHLLARRDGRVVGTATVLLAAGVAGVYFVMTMPEARRQGIGAAITLAAMRVGRDAGAHHAVLTSSPMGRSVYESVGFREVCTIRLHTWRPA
ncbi:acetyltransferase (GNAT) family protein [Diaminobutyricimonas aerilata]|uniref:Acetyltransferase (GNAT) family protein n=1 Tax=Diaminobutyricimonas aerilata TaxID=1162967 RepID=A0A2M9CML0_9MICO|nr:GNAT family N-acetyltransferase [Diaminobutyricimonas aerilata]PJJ73140.1 acetyltransferase (GNAT) family protein [Diaminobutyricimonas aerilata]